VQPGQARLAGEGGGEIGVRGAGPDTQHLLVDRDVAQARDALQRDVEAGVALVPQSRTHDPRPAGERRHVGCCGGEPLDRVLG
jgi:hypothetical protein